MSTATTIPQLTLPPAQAVRAADGPPAEPQAAVAASGASDAPGSAPSFAAVLKAKSAAAADEAGEDVARQIATADASLLALMAGLPVAPEAPRILAQLKGERLEPLPAGIPEVAQAPAAILGFATDVAPGAGPSATSDALLAVAEAMPGGVPPDAAQPALPSASPTALPASLPIAPLPTPSALAVAPAPTPGLSKAPAIGHATPAVTDPVTNNTSDAAGGMPPRQTQLAGPTAISAETGNPAGEIQKLEAGNEFRPLLERLTEHTSNSPPQATPTNPVTPQQQPAAPIQIRLSTPFADAAWAQEVDQKLGWIFTSARQQADLVLNPPDLGRVEVTLVVKGDEVNASFASPHQAVREAIEESLIRLRETLAESGINLGQTHVGRESSRDAPFVRPEGDARQARGPRQEAVIALAPASAWMPAAGRGMVDVFA